ncbi:hypothetical protein ABKA04_004051 [Annulohypoxylon sp. FPYF3050]
MADFTIEFVVDQSTGSDYRSFIEGLRPRLQNTGSWSHDRPVLPPQQNPPTSWFDIVLRTQSYAVRLRIRSDNLYVDGCRPENSEQWYEFNNGAGTHLITGSTFLGYEGSYIDLERVGSTRATTNLGQQSLITAIGRLATPDQTSSADRARSLMIVIQMISEAIRFTTISEYFATNWNESTPPTDEIIALENGWAALSRALLQADQYPEGPFSRRLRQPNAMNIREVTQAVAVIGIIMHYTISGPNRAPRSITEVFANDPQGRALLEIFWVRIDNIDSEDPGDLYGTVNATDGLGTQSLYNRTKSNYESISPGAHILLTGPPRVVSANDDFTIDLDLWDYDTLSPDDQVANGRVSWNAFDFTNTYDTVHTEQIRGTYGAASVNYVVLSNAAEALIEIILINGDGEDPANVYGNVTAGNSFGEVELYRKTKSDYEDVHPGSPITLLRKAVAVPIGDKLTVKAELWDYDSLSSDDEIANGSATFSPNIDVSTSDKINGKYGQVEVRVSWY